MLNWLGRLLPWRIMKLVKELFFPTPIYFVDFDNAGALNTFLKTRIYAWRDREPNGIVRSNVKQVGAWHSPATLHSLAEFTLFRHQITAQLNRVFADQLYSERHQAQCLNMWANINPNTGYNRSHTHPGSLWSGVYYVQTPPHCGRIIFQEPRPQAQVMPVEMNTEKQLSAEQWQEVFHEARAGRLILFPSWLRHEVEPNVTPLRGIEGDRISISFNYGQCLKEAYSDDSNKSTNGM